MKKISVVKGLASLSLESEKKSENTTAENSENTTVEKLLELTAEQVREDQSSPYEIVEKDPNKKITKPLQPRLKASYMERVKAKTKEIRERFLDNIIKDEKLCSEAIVFWCEFLEYELLKYKKNKLKSHNIEKEKQIESSNDVLENIKKIYRSNGEESSQLIEELRTRLTTYEGYESGNLYIKKLVTREFNHLLQYFVNIKISSKEEFLATGKLSFSELIAVYCFYIHDDEVTKNLARSDNENKEHQYKRFESQVICCFDYWRVAKSRFSNKVGVVFGTKNYNPSSPIMVNFKTNLFCIITYYLIEQPEEYKQFCEAANLTQNENLDLTINYRKFVASQEQLFNTLMKELEHTFEIFVHLEKNISKNLPILDDITELLNDIESKKKRDEIKKNDKDGRSKTKKNYDQNKKNNNKDIELETKFEKIACCVSDIIKKTEDIAIPVPVVVLKKVAEKENTLRGAKYLLAVVSEIELQLLEACKKNLFCSTFVERKHVSSISKYILLNTDFNNKYVIRNNLVAIYHNLYAVLDEHVRSGDFTSWNFAEKHPPTARDLISELSIFANHILEKAMNDKNINSSNEKERRLRARLWKSEDMTDDILPNKKVFQKLNIIRISEENEGMYEFENQTYRLMLAAFGFLKKEIGVDTMPNQIKNSVNDIVCGVFEHIKAFLRFYSQEIRDQTNNHLEYHLDDVAIYLSFILIASSYREALIKKIAQEVRRAIAPDSRVEQVAYILCLCLLLVQSEYNPTSEERRVIFDLYKSNIYHPQVLTYTELMHRDPFYAKYVEYEFNKSFDCNEENGYKVPPPYFIYLKAISAPSLPMEELLEENGKTVQRFQTSNLDKKTLVDAFLRIQHLSWNPNGAIVTFDTKSINTLLKTAKQMLEDMIRIEATINRGGESKNVEANLEQFKKGMQLVYAFEAFLMACSNIERAAPGSTKNWEVKTLFDCLLYAEYFQRKYNNAYLVDVNKTGEFWMQCGGYRYIASIADQLTPEWVKAKMDATNNMENGKKKDYMNVMYPIFKQSLEKEAESGNWRFYYMLSRLLEYSQFFEYDAKVNSNNIIKIAKVSDTIIDVKTVFMRYDNMENWIEELRKKQENS